MPDFCKKLKFYKEVRTLIKKAISLITAALVFAMSVQSVFAVSGKGNDYILSTDELTESYVDTALNASIFEQTLADPMPEIVQNILDTEFDMIDAKDSLFNNGDTYSINNGSTTSYNGLSDNSVIKITMKPGKQTQAWQYMCIYLGANETISFNQSTGKIAYKNTKTSAEKTIDYAFANDGTSDTVGGTIYNVYVSKTDGTLVFGIKQADETTYVWFMIENAESDNYTSLKFGTNGYRTNLSNAYVYTKKIPMPEVSEETLGEKYDKTDITASFAVCAQTDFSQAGEDITSNPTYNGISDGDVIKFNLASKTRQNESWHWFRIFLGESEALVIDQIAKKITYTNSVNTALKSVLNFNFANDDETVYNVYLEKTDGNLVIGIKESTHDSYTWMKIDNAVNDDYSFLRMRTFGFPVTISNACLYTEKETDTLYDMKLNKNVQSGNAGITLDIKRLSNKAKNNGILVTAVYVTENNVEKLYSIKFSAEKKLYKKEYTNFVNNVNIPTDRQYKIENYLWNAYSDFSPITEILELH